MVLKSDGSLFATGRNYYGQLGDGSYSARNKFSQVMTGVKDVAAGYGHTMVLKSDGSLWATGWNGKGQLGVGSTNKFTNKFVQVMTGVKYMADMTAGAWHTMVIKSDGTLWATGFNEYGQLGDGTNTDKKSFAQITFGS